MRNEDMDALELGSNDDPLTQAQIRVRYYAAIERAATRRLGEAMAARHREIAEMAANEQAPNEDGTPVSRNVADEIAQRHHAARNFEREAPADE